MARARRGLLNKFTQTIESRSTRSKGDAQIFPIRDMDIGTTARIRFVPAIDPLTNLPFTELKNIPMSFVDETDDSKQVLFRAPCLEMYDLEPFCCPVLQPVRDLWRDYNNLKENGGTKNDIEAARKLASSHWFDGAYFWQGFVQDHKLKDFQVPENPLMIFRLTKQIHNILDATMFKNEEDPFEDSPIGEFLASDLEAIANDEIPDDMSEEDFMDLFLGYDFIIRKEKPNEYVNYEQSSWALKGGESMLDSDQIAALVEHGFHDIRTKYLPPRPTDAQYEVMAEMVKVSIDGGEWNPEWEEVDKDHDFKIRGFRKRNTDSNDDAGKAKKSFSTKTRSSDEEDGETSRTSNTDKLKSLTRGRKPKEEAVSEPEDEPETIDEGSDDEAPEETTKSSRGRGAKSEPETDSDEDDGKSNVKKSIADITNKIRASKKAAG